MSQEPHSPTEENKRLATSLSGLGVPQEQISTLLGITKPTLHKYYRDELDRGLAEANAKIAQTLFSQAINGNTSAAIFWAKVRLGWNEKLEHAVSGSIEVTGIERIIIDPRSPA